MTDYRSWMPRHRAMCPEPGPLDQFVVVFINGRRVSFQPVSEFAQMRIAAEQLALAHKCQVKVLPMTGNEMMNFLAITPEPQKPLDALDPEFRKQAIQNCMDVLREHSRADEREEALNLLRLLGALHD